MASALFLANRDELFAEVVLVKLHKGASAELPEPVGNVTDIKELKLNQKLVWHREYLAGMNTTSKACHPKEHDVVQSQVLFGSFNGNS